MFMILWNYILNQLISRQNGQGSNSANDSTNNNENMNYNSTNGPILGLKALRATPINGLFALFEEWINFFLRADKRYAESRRYQTTNDNGRHNGKVAVITAGDKDIGAEMATTLSQKGFKVIIGVNEDKNDSHLGTNVYKVLKLDLSSLESIRAFAKEVDKLEPKIDLLINSAEHFEHKNIITKDGIEKNFAENYLGHYLLTYLLVDNLKKSENGRIVNVTSMAQYFGSIDFNDINNTKFYIPLKAYAQSKLAQVLFTRELSKRLIDTNITVYAVSPETARTIPALNVPKNTRLADIVSNMTSASNGSQTLLYVSLEESLKNESGFYYTNLKKVHPLLWNATDDTVAEKLWKLSEDMLKLDDGSKFTQKSLKLV